MAAAVHMPLYVYVVVVVVVLVCGFISGWEARGKRGR